MSFVAKIEADVSSFSANMNKASQDTGKFVSEINKASNAAKVIVPPAVLPSINNFSKSVGNANGVAMEFTRIIQDAPFGMIGIGNNIQQLTANFGQLKNQTGSTGAALKQTFASILTSGNLLSLGIAAITSAWTFYTMWSQKAGKETKKTKDEMDKLIESLSETSRVMYDAAKSTGKETAELNSLYNISQDTAKATNERRDAANRLIKQYPELFGKFTTEQVMLGKAKGAYDTLSSSILATARAQAAYGRIGEKASQQIAIDERNKSLQKEIDLLNTRIDREKASINNTRAVGNAGVGASSAAMAGLAARFEEKRNSLISEQTTNLLKRAAIQENILDLEKVAISNQIAISDGYGLSTEKVKTLKGAADNFAKSLEGTLMSEYARQLFEINNTYDELAKKSKGNTNLLGLIEQARSAELLRTKMKQISEIIGDVQKQNIKVVNPQDVSNIIVPEINTDAFNSKSNEKFISNIAKLAKQAGETFNITLSETITDGLGDAIANISQSIGESLANGGNVIQAMGGALLSSLGSILVSLGEMAIKAGAGILAVQIGLKTLNPFVALAAGAALVAIGSAFSSGAKNLAGAGSGGGYTQSSSGAQYNSIGDRNTGKLFNNDKQVVELRLKNGELTGAINLANKRNDRLV